MGRYLTRQILQSIPLLVGMSFVVFVILQSIPGGPLALYENRPDITPEDLERLAARYGLNTPIWERYWNWLSAFVTGDWGFSKSAYRNVITMIWERLGNTAILMGLAFIVSLIIAVPIGIIAARKQYSWFDYITTTVSFFGISIPIFWSGLLAIIVFGTWLRWFPTSGTHTVTLDETFDLWDRIRHLVLPVTVLALNSAGMYLRYVRAGMLEVLGQDYIRTARGKGLAENKVMWRHALRNASIPLVTLAALELPALFGGAIITETIFSWPGMGQLFLQASQRSDYPVLMALLMTTTALVILSNLLADIIYGVLDPRIRYR
jgi:peptide/nickel transport system permease protein